MDEDAPRGSEQPRDEAETQCNSPRACGRLPDNGEVVVLAEAASSTIPI